MLHVMNARCVARDLHTRLRPGHWNVRVGDSSRRSEEIVKLSNLRDSSMRLTSIRIIIVIIITIIIIIIIIISATDYYY